MISYELAAKAVKEGIKIRHIGWEYWEHCYYRPSCWLKVRESGAYISFSPSFRDLDDWEEYKEQPKHQAIACTKCGHEMRIED